MKFFKFIKNYISIEDFMSFTRSIVKDPKKFIEDLVKDDVIVHRPDIIRKIELDDDFANLKVGEFISYHFTKGNNPIKKLVDFYKLYNKSIIPAAGRQSLFLYMDSDFNSNSQLNFRCYFDSKICEVTGNFKSISFEQIPLHFNTNINFSEKKIVHLGS